MWRVIFVIYWIYFHDDHPIFPPRRQISILLITVFYYLAEVKITLMTRKIQKMNKVHFSFPYLVMHLLVQRSLKKWKEKLSNVWKIFVKKFEFEFAQFLYLRKIVFFNVKKELVTESLDLL